jgi:hypothetical protein
VRIGACFLLVAALSALAQGQVFDAQAVERDQARNRSLFLAQLTNPEVARQAGRLAVQLSGNLWVIAKDRRYGISFKPELYEGGPAYLPFGEYQYEASEYAGGQSCRLGVNGHFILLPGKLLLLPGPPTTSERPSDECWKRLGLERRTVYDDVMYFNPPTPYTLALTPGKLRLGEYFLVPNRGVVVSSEREATQSGSSKVWDKGELNRVISIWRQYGR